VRRKWDETFATLTAVIESVVEIDFPRDRKDAKFLASAASADADYLITGDKDFAEAQKMMNTTIISVSALKKLVVDKVEG
jgi:uncharacterized protein